MRLGPVRTYLSGVDRLSALTAALCPQMVTRTKKIFVGGLSAPSTLEDVKNYFEQFGRVSAGRGGCNSVRAHCPPLGCEAWVSHL